MEDKSFVFETAMKRIEEIVIALEKGDVALDESLTLFQEGAELIKKCLLKHNGKRKPAAKELGISERTLYRRIKELNIK